MIGIIGLNHKSAPVYVREQVVLNEEEIVQLINLLKENREFTEVVVLSTCNRTEVYFNLTKDCEAQNFNFVLQNLLKVKNVKDDIKHNFYTFSHENAVNHLFKVAAGLNSMVLGENQILGQIKEGYKISASKKFTNTIFNRLFHRAFEVGKKVRTDTAINEGASSVSYAAVELATKIFGNLSSHPVLLIGVGETGELVLQSLKERGCQHLYITNRTFSRAQAIAEKYNGEPLQIDCIEDSMQKCDIIITSTSSTDRLIKYDFVKEITKKRKNRSIFLIDLSVPRNIEDTVKKIENVFLYDIDDLEEVVAYNYERRKGEIEKAEKIIEQISKDFFVWLSTLRLTPTIESLKHKFESLIESELDSLKNKVSEDDHKRLIKFGSFIQGKYLGMIIKNLKMISNNGKKLEYIDLVNNLFELTDKENYEK